MENILKPQKAEFMNHETIFNMKYETLKFKSKLADKVLKKVTELFHFQKTSDWETKAKEEILYAFSRIESETKEKQIIKSEPLVYFALWVLQNKEHEWFNNVEIGKDKLDKVKNLCGYSAE